MKENPKNLIQCGIWICDKCGSRNLDQEWVFYAPMNEEGDEEQTTHLTQNDFYWCNTCGDECTPTNESK